MGQKIITLSGAATDVLYALFFRGALQSGDLPAKSGAAELLELGFAETRHTATEYQKENYFTFLTAEGQGFAIKHLADTRFGVPAGGYIGSPVVAEADIRGCCPIEGYKWGWFVDKSGQAYIHKALIGDGVLSTGYNVKLNVTNKGKQHEAGMTLGVEDGQSKVEFLADRYKVHEAAQSASNNEETAFNGGLAFCGFPGAISHDGANPADGNNATKTSLNDEMCEAIISAVRESDLFAALQAKIDAQTASVVGLQQAMHEAVNDALRNALKPGGILWAAISHR
ncbi:phage tail tip fiber protein [Enterobacter asburiae]|uniref:phage tail tip fiber protein n=1 Tax=Enterobacter asburiae TaxID=61645 RepID=UPI002FF4D1B0